jgi:hypothetical protein
LTSATGCYNCLLWAYPNGQVKYSTHYYGILVRRQSVPAPFFPYIKCIEEIINKGEKGRIMNLIKKAASVDKKVVFSTLWIFAILNYLYNDIFSLYFVPNIQNDTVGMASSQVLMFAFLMETAIAMVLLSRFLKYGFNRWLNVIIGTVHTALVAWSVIGTTQQPFNIMFVAIEIACTLFIIVYALTWRKPETQR